MIVDEAKLIRLLGNPKLFSVGTVMYGFQPEGFVFDQHTDCYVCLKCGWKITRTAISLGMADSLSVHVEEDLRGNSGTQPQAT